MELTGDPFLIALQISVLGVSVVFAALSLVALSLWALAKFDQRVAMPSAATDSAPNTVNSAPAADTLPPELVAVIAAAAMAELQHPVRVTRIRAFGASPGSGWARQGRLTIMASHQRRK